MDPMIISMIASSVLGYQKDQENQKAYHDMMMMQSIKDKTSGLTGKFGQQQARPSSIDPMFQSLLAGAAVGQGLRKKKPGDGAATDGDVTTSDQPPANVGMPGAQQSFASQQSPYGSASDQAMAQRFPWAQNQSQASGY